MIYTVYNISIKYKISGISEVYRPIYIGRTNNIDRRQKEHRRGYKKYLESDEIKGKKLYMFMKESGTKPEEIILNSLYKCKTKLEAKQMEAFKILWYRFNWEGQLKQKIISISDR